MPHTLQIALAGNPNSGKTSLFNALTGLNQKVGNFPGVTVDRKSGEITLENNKIVTVTDLPGSYSLYPKGEDELVACETLIDPNSSYQSDIIVVVADAANLRRNLLFCTQVIDLQKPVILVLTMMDVAKKKGVDIDIAALERQLGIPVVAVNPRKGSGLKGLKTAISSIAQLKHFNRNHLIPVDNTLLPAIQEIKKIIPVSNDYAAWHLWCNYEKMHFISREQKSAINAIVKNQSVSIAKIQGDEIMDRYNRIEIILKNSVAEQSPIKKQLITERIDKVLLHPLWGNLFLLFVLFLIFQSVFWIADYPMSLIESGFGSLGAYLNQVLPEQWWADLLVNGIVAGIGGIVIFIPQIAILFFFITILEDTGYMSRISFLTDRLMRSVGLNGRSVMPLISGLACAIPAIMAARTIENKKERLITILVTPLMSCSARLPVYTILIALVIPDITIGGVIGLQGLVLMGMYLLGFVMALILSKVMSTIIKVKESTIFLMELPVYHLPRWRNAFITMYEKAKIFTIDAGKVIIVISIALWFLASYGPNSRMEAVESYYSQFDLENDEVLQEQKATALLENTYIGIIGKTIEPAIAPLGYDWKMGIALLSSFAAREVFVGTMATLYSVGGDADVDDAPLREKMAQVKRADGTPMYNLATGLSLMVFYAFAMQCMSTIAIVKRETKSWKIALFQFFYMTGLAYAASLLVYQILK